MADIRTLLAHVPKDTQRAAILHGTDVVETRVAAWLREKPSTAEMVKVLDEVLTPSMAASKLRRRPAVVC